MSCGVPWFLCRISSPLLMLGLLSLAPVVFLCVAESIAPRHWDRLRQTLPEMSVGDLPASSQTRAGWADGVCASQAAGHGRLKGQRLHGTRGVWAVVVLLGGQERLRGVAAGWGRLLDYLAPPLTYDPLLVLAGGLSPPRGLWAALFVFVPFHRGLRATHERRIGDVGSRASRGLWWWSSAAGGAGLWGGRHRAVWAVALETGIRDRDGNEQWLPGWMVFYCVCVWIPGDLSMRSFSSRILVDDMRP